MAEVIYLLQVIHHAVTSITRARLLMPPWIMVQWKNSQLKGMFNIRRTIFLITGITPNSLDLAITSLPLWQVVAHQTTLRWLQRNLVALILPALPNPATQHRILWPIRKTRKITIFGLFLVTM